MIPPSPQNLVDCSTSYGNHGCNGGLMSKAFKYIIDKDGIDSNKVYPYDGKDGKFRYSAQGRAGYCWSFRFLPHGNEKALQYTVATVAPVSVAISSTLGTFRSYKGEYIMIQDAL
ncbi:cathepsin S-like [Scleropages formosus]|uniref:cathepsin S-like n=1 Tax=Scleropages formosus TaxID=113540 RepID=UPI0010FA873F|nr:cathepsin S-like [Scleropages formosus]XP_029104046.1 cathepsin S-like [Scleropages formosus]